MLTAEQIKIEQEGIDVLLMAARKIAQYVANAELGASDDCPVEDEATELRSLAEDAAKLFLAASKMAVSIQAPQAKE